MSSRRREFSLSRSLATSASPEAIMDRIVRPGTWPEWVPEIDSTDSKPVVQPGDDVEGEAEMLGFRVDGRARITEVTSDSLVQDVVIGVRIVARYEVVPTAEGALIRHELLVTAPRGPMGTLLSFLLRGRLRVMQRRLLKNLSVER